MTGAFFQYGTAVHLAVLTVAPLFLIAFTGSTAHAATVFWLSLFSLMWIVMNPSPRAGEWPRDARHRIGLELLRDPFLTFGIVAIVLSVIRAVNGGVALVYDVSSGIWSLGGPHVSVLPGSVSGQGLLPLTGVLGAVVVTLGVRHALGARARFAFLLASASLASLAVVCWRVWRASHALVPHLAFSPTDPFCLGSLLGIYFLFAVAAWVGSWSSDHAALEVVSAIPIAVLLVGLVFTAPVFALLTFLSAGLVIVMAGVLLVWSRRAPLSWIRTGFLLALVVSPVVFMIIEGMVHLSFGSLFPDGFAAVRASASAAALAAWKSASQLGIGLGAYPLALGFFAKPEDWQVLSAVQTAAPNGWIHFLCERGFLGCLVLLTGLGLLLRDGTVRFIRAGSGWFLGAFHLLGPVALLAVVAVTFAECSYVQPEALMPVGAALGLTVASFPDLTEAEDG